MDPKDIEAAFASQPELSLESRVLLIELQLVGLADKLNSFPDLRNNYGFLCSDRVALVGIEHLDKANARIAELEQELAKYKEWSKNKYVVELDPSTFVKLDPSGVCYPL